MRAQEFLLEGKGDKILAPNRWEQMSRLIVKGMQRDHTVDNELVKSDEGIKSVAEQLISIDPSRNGQYEVAVVKWFSNGEFFIGEDAEGISTLLTQFDSLKKRKKLPQQNNDIGRMTKAQTQEVVNAIVQADRTAELAMNKDIDNTGRMARGEEASADRGDLIIDEGTFKVFQPHTKKQAREVCKMPQGSVYASTNDAIGDGKEPAADFCTASTNNFERYSGQGPFYDVILNDGDPKSMRVFQFHYESNQFVNESDIQITESEIAILSKYPGYTKFLNMMIKEHYAEYL
jgi:hypothetical protein